MHCMVEVIQPWEEAIIGSLEGMIKTVSEKLNMFERVLVDFTSVFRESARRLL